MVTAFARSTEMGPAEDPKSPTIESSASSPASDATKPEYDTDQLYRDYGAAVGRWATKMARSAVEAEDIVQEVFLVVHRRLGEIPILRNPAPWLFRITENIVRRRWRNKVRDGNPGLVTVDEVRETAPSPLDQLERRRMMQKLEAALGDLTDEDRRLLWLCDVRRLPTSSVTALTGIKAQTLRVKRFRARRQIAERLKDENHAAPGLSRRAAS